MGINLSRIEKILNNENIKPNSRIEYLLSKIVSMIDDHYTKEEITNLLQDLKDEIESEITGAFKIKGSLYFSEIPTDTAEEGDVYNIKDAFVTDSSFMESGVECVAGTNIVMTDSGKWDILSTSYDFSDFLLKSDVTSMTEDEINEICVI